MALRETERQLLLVPGNQIGPPLSIRREPLELYGQKEAEKSRGNCALDAHYEDRC